MNATSAPEVHVSSASSTSAAIPQAAPALAGPRQQAWFRALDRARLTGVRPCYLMGRDYYRVTSPRAGDVYEVKPVQVSRHITYSCTCQAGMAGHPCWHAALVAALPYECQRRRAYKASNAPCRECGQIVSTVTACEQCEQDAIPASDVVAGHGWDGEATARGDAERTALLAAHAAQTVADAARAANRAGIAASIARGVDPLAAAFE